MKKSREFENISQFKRFLDKNSDVISKNGVLHNTGRFEFYQTETWSDFEDYLQIGNTEITSKIKKDVEYYMDKFEQELSFQSQYEFQVTGEFFDIGAVMMGEPEAWIKEIKIEDEKFITLDIQGCYSHGTNLDMVRKNGSKVYAIATILEEKGFSVRINMHYSTRRSNGKPKDTYELIMRVKDYDSVLDYKKFGILLGIPFFRRGFLRMLEIEYGDNVAMNFGVPLYEAEGEIILSNDKSILELEEKLKG